MKLAVQILSGVVGTVLGIIGSWLGSRYYYLKSRPEQTSARAMIAAVKKGKLGKTKVNLQGDPRVPLRWALELIRAFEANEIYLTEFLICVKAVREVEKLLGVPIRAADQAGAEAVGQTLSPPWHEARRKALREKLAEVKADIKSRLQENRKT